MEEELKLIDEFDHDKRKIMTRLRYMEAYCQNPTPPPTPDKTSDQRQSIDVQLPERKVTERDYHNLAQQYRERDVIDSLHASRINVLRGKQKKAIESFIRNRERDIDALERQHEQEIDSLDRDAVREEEALKLTFATKRNRLESRWRLQNLVATTKIERATGQKYAPLPDLRAVEDGRDEH